MQTEKTEFVLDEQNGSVIRRTVYEEKVNIEQSLMDELGAQVIRQAKLVLSMPPDLYPNYGPANLAIANEGNYWTIPILKLPLKTHYHMDNGVLYPMFSAKDDPVMPLSWTPPTDMKLVMIVLCKNNDGHRYPENQWLFAFDSDKRAWRLPLGNSYPDGRLCSGDFNRYLKTDYECIKAELDQLAAGQWQGDLDKAPAETKALFRFKPQNDTFEQLPPERGWTNLCQKIAPAVLKFAVL